MPCSAVTDIVVRESGRYLANEIYKRMFGTSPWFSIMPRGEYPRELGLDPISVLTYERSAPLDAEPTWTPVVVVDGQEGGACLPPVTKVGIGSTTRNFDLRRRVLEGPDFCAEELRSPFAVSQQLQAITGILAEYSKIEWEIRDRHEYFRLVQTKAVSNGCPPTKSITSATTFPATCPTSILTQGILDYFYIRLMRDGATPMGQPNVLTAILSAEASNDIIMRNPEIRQDFRWADPGVLLKRLGVSREYKGYYHLIDLYPIRGSCTGGVFTEIPAFSQSAATKGQKADINPTWENTAGAGFYEVSFIWDPTVMTQLIPAPVVNPAPNFSFNPVNYTGMWKMMNIIDRVCNPDGTIIFPRGILASGSQPVHPERGVAISSLRCDPACNLVSACS